MSNDPNHLSHLLKLAEAKNFVQPYFKFAKLLAKSINPVTEVTCRKAAWSPTAAKGSAKQKHLEITCLKKCASDLLHPRLLSLTCLIKSPKCLSNSLNFIGILN
jgi:hypothetical protein